MSLIPYFGRNALTASDNPLDDIFDSFFRLSPVTSRNHKLTTRSTPRANVVSTDKGYTISLAAPGYSRGDFNVTVEDGALTISCEAKEQSIDVDVQHREHSYSAFSRSWSLPDGVSYENISASYEAGILDINVPVEAKRNERKITVDIN